MKGSKPRIMYLRVWFEEENRYSSFLCQTEVLLEYTHLSRRVNGQILGLNRINTLRCLHVSVDLDRSLSLSPPKIRKTLRDIDDCVENAVLEHLIVA